MRSPTICWWRIDCGPKPLNLTDQALATGAKHDAMACATRRHAASRREDGVICVHIRLRETQQAEKVDSVTRSFAGDDDGLLVSLRSLRSSRGLGAGVRGGLRRRFVRC